VRVYAPEKRFLQDVVYVVQPEKKYKDMEIPEGYVCICSVQLLNFGITKIG
jgi:hypothetical protein